MPDSHLLNIRFHNDPTLQQVRRGQLLLKKGSRGDGILAIQNALLDMGFNLQAYTHGGRNSGGPDGQFGPQTLAALMNFQAHASCFYEQIKPDGVIGPLTMEALDGLAPTPGSQAWESNQPTQLPQCTWNGEIPLRVVVVKSEHRTFLFDDGGLPLGIFSNATGAAASRTDTGLKVISTKIDEKGARSAGITLWSAPSAFGARILNLSWADGRHSGEELHGTGRPDQMGMNVSHGCVRHYNQDIIKIYDQVKVGDKVAIVDRINDPRLLEAPIRIA